MSGVCSDFIIWVSTYYTLSQTTGLVTNFTRIHGFIGLWGSCGVHKSGDSGGIDENVYNSCYALLRCTDTIRNAPNMLPGRIVDFCTRRHKIKEVLFRNVNRNGVNDSSLPLSSLRSRST